MYLSKLTLNRQPRTFHWASDDYHIHQRLCMAAGDDPRLLYRLDLPSRVGQGDAHILVQTIQQPDWAAAFDQFPVLGDAPLCKQVSYDLHAGQLLTFRLRANPTARKRLPDGSKKRVGVHKEDDQRAWLRRKADLGGFTVLRTQVRQEAPVITYVGGEGRRRRAKLDAALFEGIVQVRDPALMRATLAQGIGSAKGFGFGLLSIGPARG